MEMCYDGALVLPSSYAVMDEEEMTYVEGGLTLYKTADAIKSRCTSLRIFCRACAIAGILVGACLVETVLGAIAAGAAASMFWSWADAFANCGAQTENIIANSKKRGNQRVKYTEKTRGLTLILSVSKA